GDVADADGEALRGLLAGPARRGLGDLGAPGCARAGHDRCPHDSSRIVQVVRITNYRLNRIANHVKVSVMTSPRPDGAPYPEGAPRPDGGTDALDSLVTLGFVVTATMTRIGAAHDLSFTLVRVLGLLEDAPRRVSDLAAHLGLE